MSAAAAKHRPAAYWLFFWPLALMSVAWLAGKLGQNAILLSYPDGDNELAVFSLASSILWPLIASVAFLPQASNVLVRSRQALGVFCRFVLIGCVLLTTPLVLFGWTPLGRIWIPMLFTVDAETVERVMSYLRWFTPILPLMAFNQVLGGILMQRKMTGRVTTARIADLGTMLLLLILGLKLGLPAIPVITVSWVASNLAGFVVTAAFWLRAGGTRIWKPDTAGGEEEAGIDRLPVEALTVGAVFGYYWPMALTSIMFALSRPIIFNLVTRLNPTGDPAGPDVDAIIAALTLAFTFAMLFQGIVNQFRNVSVTFDDDPVGVKRFMVHATALLTGVMALMVATPVDTVFLRIVQQADGRVLTYALDTLWVLLLVPVTVAWRNWYHGRAMIERKTAIMGFAAVFRNLAIYLAGWGFLATGTLDALTGAFLIVLGFFVEGLVVMLRVEGGRLLRRPAPPAVEPDPAESVSG
ncbi:MAG: MATE family efflux transporter [Opitutales bacterium]